MNQLIIQQTPENVSSTLEVLAWLCFARRSLHIRELQGCIAIDVGTTKLDESRITLADPTYGCRRLVTVTPGTQLVSIAHFSVQEYLTRNLDKWAVHFPPLCRPHCLLARKCLAYLRLEQFMGKPPSEIADLGNRFSRYQLLAYAAMNWDWHAQKAEGDEFFNDALGLFSSDAQTTSAGLIMAMNEHHPEHCEQAYRGMRPLHVSAIFGLAPLVEHLLLSGSHDLNAVTYGDWTALHWAARHGSEEVLRILLQRGAETNTKTKANMWTPLHLAAKEGHHLVITLLLDFKAQVNVTDLLGRTPLYWACLTRQINVVKVLLSRQNRADAKIGNIHRTTPLHCAAKQGGNEIVRMLLAFSDANAMDALGCTALDEAMRKGHQSVIGTLASSVDPSARLSLSLTISSSSNLKNDTDWTAYEVDEEETSKIHHGSQCISQVLKKTGNKDTVQRVSYIFPHVRFWSAFLSCYSRSHFCRLYISSV